LFIGVQKWPTEVGGGRGSVDEHCITNVLRAYYGGRRIDENAHAEPDSNRMGRHTSIEYSWRVHRRSCGREVIYGFAEAGKGGAGYAVQDWREGKAVDRRYQ
jgi:hypothetical protein